MKTLTSNQYYGALNRRFEKRAALLRRCGFVYKIVCEGVAVFSRPNAWKSKNVTAAEVMHANGMAWVDLLKQHLSRGIVI